MNNTSPSNPPTRATCAAGRKPRSRPPSIRRPPIRRVLPAPPPAGSPNAGIQAINENVRADLAWVQPLRQEMARVIVGQEQLIDRLLVGLIGNGHVLLEGVPGLAKTLALKTLAARHPASNFSGCNSRPTCCRRTSSARMIYNPRDGTFSTKHGPGLRQPHPRR